VITCPRCGQPVRSGTPACGSCGARLAPMQAPAVPLDDGMPPWLRSLQAGISQANQGSSDPLVGAPFGAPRPGPQAGAAYPGAMGGGGGGGAGPQMPASSLVSEDALPEWLRGAVPAQPQAGAQPAQPAWPAQQPAFGQGPAQVGWGAAQPGQGYGAAPAPMPPARISAAGSASVAAGMLFDESALPDWLRQGSGGLAGGGAGAGAGAGIDAQATVQRMPSVGARPQPYGQSPAPSMQAPGHMAAQGFGGGAGAMQGFGGPAQGTEASAFPSLDRVGSAGSFGAPQGGLAAGSLIDAGALPGWLSGGQPGAQPTALPAPSARPGAGGMSASSLIDESALPEWLRAQPNAPAAQSPIGAGQVAAAPGSAFGAQQSWLAPAGPPQPFESLGGFGQSPARPEPAANPWAVRAPAPPPGSYGTPGGVSAPRIGMSAGELVDEGALPDWMRAQAGATGGSSGLGFAPSPALSGRADGAGPTGYNAPRGGNAPLYGEPDAAKAGPLFSAADLIDPQAVPSWARGPEPQRASPSDNLGGDGMGWGAQQPGMSAPGAAGPASSMASSRVAPSSWDSGSRAFDESGLYGGQDMTDDVAQRGQSAARASDELRGGGAGMASDPGRSGLAGKAPRGRPIPQEELPPWLQGTGGGAQTGQRFAGRDQGRPRQYGGYDEFGAGDGYDAGGGWGDPAGGAPYGQGGHEQPYDERYGQYPDQEQGGYYDEFGGGYDQRYADPYGQQGGYEDYPDGEWGEEPYDEPGQDGKRGWRRLFGRR